MATISVPRFPSNVPAVAVQRRAVGLSTAGITGDRMWRQGEFWSWTIYRNDGSILSTSPDYPTKDIPEILAYDVPYIRNGYSCILTYRNYPGTPGYYYEGHSRFPFYFQKKEQRKNGEKSFRFLILIKGRDDGLSRTGARHTARLRAERANNPRKSREWTPASGRRNNEQTTASIPTWNYNNGSGTQGSFTVVTYQRTRGGTVTPNYLKRKKANTLPVNAYSMTLVTNTDGGALIDTWNGNGVGGTQSQGFAYEQRIGTAPFGNAPGGSTVPTSVTNRAIKKLQGKTGPESANIAQDLLQMSQLTNLIGDTAVRLADSMRALKHGNIAKAVQTLWHTDVKPRYKKNKYPSPTNSIADNWLALQYGWKPLLQDIRGLMDSIARLQLGSVVVYTARSTAHHEENRVSYMSLGVANSPRIGTQTETFVADVRYGIRYQIDNHLKAFLAQTGFTNPINLAWEVLPYSFVVDWFIPIGPYLEQFSAWDGLVFNDGWKSVTTKLSTTWNVGYSGKLNVSDPNDVQMISYIGSRRREEITYARTKLTAFPSQVIPTFKNPVSPQHALNGLALLISAFKK